MTRLVHDRSPRGPAAPLASAVAAVLLVAALGGLAGCAAPPQADLKTASDMTDVDRRARLRLELASGYFARGQMTTALDEVKQALAARPDMPEALSLRGLIYASMGEPELADQSFQRALQVNPRDASTMHNYGYFLCRSGRFEDAMAQFERAIAQPQYREVPRTLTAKGLCEVSAGRTADAERTLSRAYEMDPANPSTAYYLGDVLYRLGEYERARFYLRRVNGQPATSNAQSLWLAARIEQRLGNALGVRELGEQLQSRFPQSPEALRYEKRAFDD
jgi:type IV pilus assembly protein PilF